MSARETKCWKCFGFINDQKVRFQEKQYHPLCFVCDMCKKPLAGVTCHEEGGKLHCQQCYNILQEDRCARCKTLIKSNKQLYKGKGYHPECFTCHSCKQSLEGQSFHFDDGKFYHEDCYRNVNAYKCDECKQQIDGNDINFSLFRGKYYHHRCFACAQCNKPLGGETFKVLIGQRYCKQCR
ncbi:four and a half LIM domains protein 1-like [Hydractinia symbiolongicarpus]|uniref:four and a half LIM domains protein 1-like n=1 Tax=Hydractinia symbiolongicarpus TaxID=13093 RepID=UPI00254AC7D6|nr:four and a half LIM domains protein 1-like [Hydractinia symbiolongicarpus]